MIGKARALGLALMAVLAMSAIAASAAEAVPTFTGYETTAGNPKVHTTVTATTAAGTVEALKAGFGSVECHVTYTGTDLTGDAQSLTVTPSYEHPGTTGDKFCTTNVGGTKFKTHVKVEGGCNFRFNVTTKLAFDEYTGIVDVCPGGGQIHLNITKLAAEETKCTVTLGKQEARTHIILRNEKKPAGETHVLAEASVKKIAYTATGGLLNCGVNNSFHEDGTYTAKSTVSGTNTAGTPVDLEVSGE